MTEAKRKTVQCLSMAGLHQMAYKEWGDPGNPNVLVCVHGVTRVGDDFDELARAMSDRYRVVCPDVVGRGRSGRLRNPALYVLPQYGADMITLLARVLANGERQTVDWLGTSMGGLIGMGLASLPDSPISKLIINDIGPTLDPVALNRIGDYIGVEMRFPTFEAGVKYIRDISQPFGEHTEAQWEKLARDVMLQLPDGQWTRNYDMGLAVPFKAATPEATKADEVRVWAAYDAIRCPTLLVRGANSDLLSPATAKAMTERGPKAALVEVPNVGHAPTFNNAHQIDIVRKFLLAD